MSDDELVAGEWPLLTPATYNRLVRLARWRLAGYGSHAEDVVSRSLIKWASLPAPKRAVARIEQVIKTEAASWYRSEQRMRQRESKAITDRSIGATELVGPGAEVEMLLVKQILYDVASQNDIKISSRDIIVVEDLLAGLRVSEIVSTRKLSRYRVTRSREKWRIILRLAGVVAEE